MSTHPRLALAHGALAVTAFVTGSCASYSARTEKALRDFQGGQFARSSEVFGDEEEIGSAFLSGVEAGTVALTAGEWESAQAFLGRAAEASREIEGRALLGAEELGEGLLSWALNDTARAYQGEGFERVYVHCGLALTYLAQGLLDDVYVEARLANQLLEAEEKLYRKKYRAGGWGHLISAIAYELLDEPDQAYVDYLRMEEKGVGTQLAGPALVRLATHMHRNEDLARWTERYGPYLERPEDAASIVVLAGVGLGPTKVEGNLLLPTPDGVIAFAGVAYRTREQACRGLRLVAGELSSETTVIEDVSSVARQNLEDRQLWTHAKSVARGLLKRGLTKKLEDEHGLAGRVAGDLFAIATERADLRHWRTLPDTWQATRLFVPPGVLELRLEALGGRSVDLGSFELEPGETMLVFARSLGTNVYAHAIGGRPIGGDS